MSRYAIPGSRPNLPRHPLHVHGSRPATGPKFGSKRANVAAPFKRRNTLEGFMGAIRTAQKAKFFSRPGMISHPGRLVGMRIWERSRRIARTPGTYPVRTFVKSHKQIRLHQMGVQGVRPIEQFYQKRPWGSQFMPNVQADLAEVPSFDTRPIRKSHQQKFVQRDQHGFLRNRLKK